jgi:hypothetical protein
MVQIYFLILSLSKGDMLTMRSLSYPRPEPVERRQAHPGLAARKKEKGPDAAGPFSDVTERVAPGREGLGANPGLRKLAAHTTAAMGRVCAPVCRQKQLDLGPMAAGKIFQANSVTRPAPADRSYFQTNFNQLHTRPV